MRDAGLVQDVTPPTEAPAPPAPADTIQPLAQTDAECAAAAFHSLGQANIFLHTLAKGEPSGELTEAIDAIARARRLVSARYLTGTPAKGG